MDLRKVSLDEFVKFTFDHQIQKPAWYEHESFDEIDWDLDHNLALLTEMSLRADELLVAFTEEQIDQGFWFLCGPGCLFSNVLMGGACWNLSAPVEARLALVKAIPHLYFKLFERLDCSRMNAHWMMWDLISDGADLSGNSTTDEGLVEQLARIKDKAEMREFLDIHKTEMFKLSTEAEADYIIIRQGMLNALSLMLREGNEVTQQCALHGLNHLNHPERSEVITRFLAEHPELSEDVVAFAGLCARGEYM